MTAQEFDLVIVGAGPGGYVAAIRAAQLGLKAACVEKEPALGGTCLRIGCIPSKALLESSELFLEAKERFVNHGIRLPTVELDLAAMLRRKEQVVSTLTRGVDSLFKKNKISRYLGHARFTGPGRVDPHPLPLSCLRWTHRRHLVLYSVLSVSTLRGLLVASCVGRSSNDSWPFFRAQYSFCIWASVARS